MGAYWPQLTLLIGSSALSPPSAIHRCARSHTLCLTTQAVPKPCSLSGPRPNSHAAYLHHRHVIPTAFDQQSDFIHAPRMQTEDLVLICYHHQCSVSCRFRCHRLCASAQVQVCWGRLSMSCHSCRAASSTTLRSPSLCRSKCVQFLRPCHPTWGVESHIRECREYERV